MTWSWQTYAMEVGKGVPVHSSVAFDLVITSLLGPLVNGGYILLVPEELGLAGLLEVFEREEDLTLVKLTPAHLKLLGDQIPAAAGRTRAFVIGGENLLTDHISFWQSSAPDTALINEYGPTETVVGCCVYWPPREAPHFGTVPIGRPILNTRLYILDQQLQPVPIGVPGELYIGGAGVARGYYGRPDLTAERPIPDPFGNEPGSRLYRTGDLARYLPNGDIECLGRMDEQVKIRGFRVELGEIEAVLRQHTLVQDAAVVAKGDTPETHQLVAYFVPAGPDVPDPDELRLFLKESLPAYMIPPAFVALPAPPLTTNGKVDRRSLSQLSHDPEPELSEQPLTPRSDVEQMVSEVWQTVLGLRRIELDDNFFDVGGNSLLLVRVQSMIEERVGRKLPLAEVLKHPTVRSLAADVAPSQQQPNLATVEQVQAIA